MIKMDVWSPTLTISDHFVKLWAENTVQGFLWEGSRCPPASLRLGCDWGTVCQGPNVQTSCGNTQGHTKTNLNTHACTHTYTKQQPTKYLTKNVIININFKWQPVECNHNRTVYDYSSLGFLCCVCVWVFWELWKDRQVILILCKEAQTLDCLCCKILLCSVLP